MRMGEDWLDRVVYSPSCVTYLVSNLSATAGSGILPRLIAAATTCLTGVRLCLLPQNCISRRWLVSPDGMTDADIRQLPKVFSTLDSRLKKKPIP